MLLFDRVTGITYLEGMGVIGDRIRQLRERRGLSQEELGLRAERSQGLISQLETGVTKWTEETLQHIAKVLGVSIAQIFLPDPLPVIALTEAGPDGYHLSDYSVGAGFDYIQCPPDVLHPHAYALQVRGDSMVPTLYDGWRVIVIPQRPPSRTLAVVGFTDGQRFIKRIRYRGDMTILESANPSYEPIEVHDNEIEFIHRVVWIKPT